MGVCKNPEWETVSKADQHSNSSPFFYTSSPFIICTQIQEIIKKFASHTQIDGYSQSALAEVSWKCWCISGYRSEKRTKLTGTQWWKSNRIGQRVRFDNGHESERARTFWIFESVFDPWRTSSDALFKRKQKKLGIPGNTKQFDLQAKIIQASNETMKLMSTKKQLYRK